LVRPRDYRFLASFEFQYGMTGDYYMWLENFVIGPNGFTYFIVGCCFAGVIGLIIIVSIIMCIVKCCRSSNATKVEDISHNKLENG
jgi:uncharacterized membrane protein